jgi:hypothetical protein
MAKAISVAAGMALRQLQLPALHKEEIDQRRHRHASNGSQDWQSALLSGRKLPFDPLTLDLQPHDEEEHGHQPIVDP